MDSRLSVPFGTFFSAPLLLFSCSVLSISVTPRAATDQASFPALHYRPEFAQTHVHWVDDTIWPSCSLLPPPLFPRHAQCIFHGFEVTFPTPAPGGKVAPGNGDKQIFLLLMKMKSSESILLLATIKAIIKEMECSSGNENTVWLVGFIIREVMSYPLSL